ncbi:MAG: ABC transporter ATP-binding protein, partial [Chloroflexota bacterium]
ESFDGVLITVSHDRYFLDRTVEHIFAFEGQGLVKQYPGNYSAYHLRKQALEEAKKNETTKQPSIQSQKGKPKTTRPRKLSYNEKRELETLEEKITEMEAEQEDLTTQVNAIGDDYQRLQILSDQLNKLEADLEIAMDRWVVLSEIEAE